MRRLVLLLVLGCSEPTPVEVDYEVQSQKPRDPAPAATDTELAQVVADNRAFAVDLYRLAAREPGNLFMSPHSLSTALAMTWAGARGATADQMGTALRFTLPADRVHVALNRLDLEMAARATAMPNPLEEQDTVPYRLEIANSTWGQDGFTWHDEFLDTLAINYGAGLNVQDFKQAPEAARASINDWVKARTTDRIAELFKPGTIDADTRLVLSNAIYFSASWDKKFDPAHTASRPFYVDGAAIDVPTMHQTSDHLNYTAGDGYRAVELKYDGHDVSLFVIEPDDLAAFEATLTGDSLVAILGAVARYEVELALPKFQFASPLDVAPLLVELGMVDAMSTSADFSGMTADDELMIDRVEHEGAVALDENGTVAAAASGVSLSPVSLPEHVIFAVDRPFLFVIREKASGAVLFIGRVVDPR